MGARLQRKDFSEKPVGCWSAEEAAAEGKEAACRLGLGWEACRDVACIGYAEDWGGGAGRLVGAWGGGGGRAVGSWSGGAGGLGGTWGGWVSGVISTWTFEVGGSLTVCVLEVW